jgi:hypothetical protein
MVNVLNRIIVSIALLVLTVLLLAVAVTPQGVAEFLAFQLNLIQVDPISVQHLIIAAVCLVLCAIFVVILRLQWARGQPRSVPLTGQGSTHLATESVVERLRQDVVGVSQVRQVTPTILSRGKVVDVALDVHTDADVDVPTKASEVEQVARDSVNRLGLKLGRVRVKIAVARGSAAPPAPSSS